MTGEIQFSEAEQEILSKGRAAGTGLRRSWSAWLDVGRAIQVVRKRVDASVEASGGGSKTKGLRLYATLEANGLGWLKTSRRTVSYLREIFERLPEIEKWRSGLTDAQRINFASPHSVYARCGLFNAGKETKPVVKPQPMTLAEFLRLPADLAADLLIMRCPAKAYALSHALAERTATGIGKPPHGWRPVDRERAAADRAADAGVGAVA